MPLFCYVSDTLWYSVYPYFNTYKPMFDKPLMIYGVGKLCHLLPKLYLICSISYKYPNVCSYALI